MMDKSDDIKVNNIELAWKGLLLLAVAVALLVGMPVLSDCAVKHGWLPVLPELSGALGGEAIKGALIIAGCAVPLVLTSRFSVARRWVMVVLTMGILVAGWLYVRAVSKATWAGNFIASSRPVKMRAILTEEWVVHGRRKNKVKMLDTILHVTDGQHAAKLLFNRYHQNAAIDKAQWRPIEAYLDPTTGKPICLLIAGERIWTFDTDVWDESISLGDTVAD